jgi:hypothetical protein
VALAALPAAASAQLPRPSEEGWGPKFRITPFVGVSPGFTSSGVLTVLTGDGDLVPDDFTYTFAGGPVMGLNAEVRAHGRFSGVGSVLWTSRDNTQGTFISDDVVELLDAGSDFLIAKLGGSMRFVETDFDLQMRRLSASLFAGGAFIREMPDVPLFSPSEFTGSRNQFGINIGAEAELPLSDRRFAFHAGVEDFVMWLDNAGIEERLRNDVRGKWGDDAIAEVDSDRAHLWLVRIGLSYRFGNNSLSGR